jgi:hypothetical protein
MGSGFHAADQNQIHPLRFCPRRGDMHRTVRTNLKCFKELTRVGALPRIGVTGVVVFSDYHSMADNQILSK